MKQNKELWIALGCVVVLCLCLGAVLAVWAGVYLFRETNVPVPQATVPPTRFSTQEPNLTPIPRSPEKPSLDDLARISVLPTTYSDSTGGEADGIAIDLVYFDRNDEVITFDGEPIEITIELFAFKDFLSSSDIASGDKVYEGVFRMDHSSTLEEMFDNYIRIPYADLDVNPNEYVRFGAVRVTVDAPGGVFEDVSTLVTLYPEQ